MRTIILARSVFNYSRARVCCTCGNFSLQHFLTISYVVTRPIGATQAALPPTVRHPSPLVRVAHDVIMGTARTQARARHGSFFKEDPITGPNAVSIESGLIDSATAQ